MKKITLLLLCCSVLLFSACLKSYLERQPDAFIYPEPSNTNIKVGDEVEFWDSSDFSSSSEWELSGPSTYETRSTVSFIHTFTQAGTYTLKLTTYSDSKKKSDYIENTYEVTSGSGGGGGGGGGSSSCLVGVWQKTYCGVVSTLTYNADGSGSFHDTDCSGAYARDITFTWTESSGSVTWHYLSFNINGQAQTLPSDETNSFTCDAHTYTSNGVTYNR